MLSSTAIVIEERAAVTTAAAAAVAAAAAAAARVVVAVTVRCRSDGTSVCALVEKRSALRVARSPGRCWRWRTRVRHVLRRQGSVVVLSPSSSFPSRSVPPPHAVIIRGALVVSLACDESLGGSGSSSPLSPRRAAAVVVDAPLSRSRRGPPHRRRPCDEPGQPLYARWLCVADERPTDRMRVRTNRG